MLELKLYDSAVREKIDFKPLTDGKISMYVCGLTVYDLPHIGHARTFVVFDVFRRFLKEIGYEVLFVRNHTDIDDKIIRRAKEENTTPQELANRMIDALHADMASIDVMQADIEPRVTEHIPDIIYKHRILQIGFGYGFCAQRISRHEDTFGKMSTRFQFNARRR